VCVVCIVTPTNAMENSSSPVRACVCEREREREREREQEREMQGETCVCGLCS